MKKPFILFAIFMTLIISTNLPVYSSDSTDASQEEMEMLNDYGTALKETISSTKSELEIILSKYVKIRDKFGNHKHPEILKLINYLDQNGLTKHLNNGIGTLGKYEKGIKEITGIKSDFDKITSFYDRYKPDKNNPTRSLEQISHALEDLNSFIVKIDPTGGVLTKPIREIISFYQNSAGAFKGALDRVKNRIKERGGGGIGQGFQAFTDKEKSFIKKFPGETVYKYSGIKYIKPGSTQEAVEFWDNLSNRAFAWKNNHWIEIKPGISGLKKVYDGMFLAFGNRPDNETLISRCNTGWDKVMEAEKNGKKYFNLLYSNNECVSKILNVKKIRIDNFSKKEFIARYIFRNDTRKKIDLAVKQIYNSILVEGRIIEEKSGSGLSGITISADSSGVTTETTSQSGGWFTLLFNLKPENSNGITEVSIKAMGYKPYRKEHPLRQHCNSWQTIALQSEQENDQIVKVPGLIGMKTLEAYETLAKLNLLAVKSEGIAPSSKIQSNIVIWQKPEKNTMVSKGSRVSFQAYNIYIETKTPDTLPEEPGTGSTIAPEKDGNLTDETNTSSTGEGLPGYDGGHVITGPSSMITGQSATFSVCDGQGKQYPPSGSYTWLSTMEPNFSIGKGGNPVNGTALKAGNATILLKFDGASAYFDLTIRAKVPDVTSLSYKDAAGAIDSLNLIASHAETYNQTEEKNSLVVISQIPAPGTIVEENTNIVLKLGKGKKKNLFSMSSSEKVEKSNSIFSMSSGEKVSDSKTEENNSNSGISLLGENTNTNSHNSFSENRPEKNNLTDTPESKANNKSEQKIVIRYHGASNDHVYTLELWCNWQSYWYFEVKLENVSLEELKGKNAYLLVEIDKHPFYLYHFYKSQETSTGYYNDNDLTVKGTIPFRSIGTHTVEVSCPALPHIPKVTQQVIVGPCSEKKQARLRNNLSQSAYAGLQQLKQRYNTAVAGDQDSSQYYYNVGITAKKYAHALVVAAESHCLLGNYKSAHELNALAILVLEKYLYIEDSYNKSNFGIGLAIDYLLTAYTRQANISLMGLDDKKGYLVNASALVKLALYEMEKLKKSDRKKVTSYAMIAAENMLTLGFKKTEAEPYYNIAIRGMDISKSDEWIAYARGNCYMFFIKNQ